MVRLLLEARNRLAIRSGMTVAGLTILLALFLAAPAGAAKRPKVTVTPSAPDLLMDGGRKLSFERSFSHYRVGHILQDDRNRNYNYPPVYCGWMAGGRPPPAGITGDVSQS